jgi:MFS family permease
MKTNKLYYGWILAALLGLSYYCSTGSILSGGQLINPQMLSDESMGMTGTWLGLGFSAFVLFQGLGAPFVGWLISKVGSRATLISGGIIIALSALAMATVVSTPIMYVIVFGPLMSVSTLMAGQVCVQSTAGVWFSKNRGKAMTLLMSIGRIAGFATPVIIGFILSNVASYKMAWFYMVGTGIIVVLIGIFFVKNKPADMGLAVDGISPEDEAGLSTADGAAKGGAGVVGKQLAGVYKRPASESFTLGKAIRTPAFWLIAILGNTGFNSYALTTSQGVLHFSSLGYDNVVIVSAVALLGVFAMAGNIIGGVISDRIEPVRILTVSVAMIAVAIFAAAFINHVFVVYFYYCCVGFFFGAVATNLPTTVANYFGPNNLSKVLGLTMFICGTAGSFIGVMGGAIFDSTGTLVLAYAIIGAIAVVGVICGLFVRTPRQEEVR